MAAIGTHQFWTALKDLPKNKSFRRFHIWPIGGIGYLEASPKQQVVTVRAPSFVVGHLKKSEFRLEFSANGKAIDPSARFESFSHDQLFVICIYPTQNCEEGAANQQQSKEEHSDFKQKKLIECDGCYRLYGISDMQEHDCPAKRRSELSLLFDDIPDLVLSRGIPKMQCKFSFLHKLMYCFFH